MIFKIVGEGPKKRYLIDGQEVSKKEFDKALPDKPLGTGGDSLCGWKRPIESDALAVHPKQIKEAMEDARKKGVAVEFTDDGRPKFTSTKQRAAYCKAYGFYDRNAGYSDRAPQQVKGGGLKDDGDPVTDIIDY